MYRAKAKTIAQAVARNAEAAAESRWPVFSCGACYGTNLYRRLAFVEVAEKTPDWLEYVRITWALRRFGSVRAAVVAGEFGG